MNHHLLTCRDLTLQSLHHLLSKANHFLFEKNTSFEWKNKTVCLFFSESSTRTRISFEIAAKRLGAHVIHFEEKYSALNKNETYKDTFANISATGVDLFVVRHPEDHFVSQMADAMQNFPVSFVNAGDGCHEHPTQALLDMMTISQFYSDWKKLKVAIVGDILHSRVAHSVCHLLLALNVEDIRLAGPKALLPEKNISPSSIRCFDTLDPALEGADVVMTLRIQKERLRTKIGLSDEEYFKQYGITPENLKRASPKAIVMHPGPMNRGIEIDSVVAEGPQSVILKQVTNGVAMRMAVMDSLFNGYSFIEKTS